MKAVVSPVRSLRQADAAIRSLSESSVAIGSGSAGTDLALDSLLYDMNGCYSRLRQLVPTLATSRKASKMEILQHVIDYILDLQVALDAEPGHDESVTAETQVCSEVAPLISPAETVCC
uniref:DNA-binding protein inhibitor ID-3-B-like n=1 Tax=Myxine glutinosa TaxID=7769 RepID=UPI00358FBEA3